MTTPVEAWDLEHRPLPRFETGPGRVVVVSAHPDDETLAVGGLMMALARAGARLTLVVATDGEAAFPGWDEAARGRLGRRRRDEMSAALAALGLDGVPVTWMGFPDSRLDRGELASALEPVLRHADVCLAPWPDDPHPDHRAAGLAARDAAGPATAVWGYPLWTWVWQDPAVTDLPWAAAAAHRLAPADRSAKRSAVAAFGSQVRPGPGGEEPIVDAGARRHFDLPVEVVFRLPGPASTPLDRFEGLYSAGPDPWGTATRAYERRKRAVTLASLPRARYGPALDAGSGSGVLTAELAARCDRILALDGAAGAVDATRAATAGLANVSVVQAGLPAGLPAGPFDLLVFSEVLYYLSLDDLAGTLDRAEVAARPGTDLVAVDWRPVTPDAPRDADSAHRQLLGRPGWQMLVEHREPEFLLHVLRRR